MRQFAHFAGTATSVVLMVALVGNLAAAGPAATASDHQYDRTPVCHATRSEKNPYVFLKVPRDSAHFGMHQGDLFGPTIEGKDDCPDGKSKAKAKNDAKGKSKGRAK